jgi:hypothetical protein
VQPIVARVSEVHPALRRLHVVGELHPGELAERGYARRGGEWVLEIRRPTAPGRDADVLVREFQALAALGYDFAAGDEWSPLELYRKYRDLGRLTGEKR